MGIAWFGKFEQWIKDDDAASIKRRICLCWNHCQWCNCQCVAHSAQLAPETPTHSCSDGTLTRQAPDLRQILPSKTGPVNMARNKSYHVAITVFMLLWLRTQFLWDVTHHYLDNASPMLRRHTMPSFSSRGPKKKNLLRAGTMGTTQPFSPRMSRSPPPQCSNKTDSVTCLFMYHRRDIIFTLTLSPTSICEGYIFVPKYAMSCRLIKHR